MWRWLNWLGVASAMCGTLGCGGRAEHDGASSRGGAAGSSAGSSDAGSSGESDGTGGVHSVFLACELCTYQELDCHGPELPESQSTFRTSVSGYGCDFEPSAGYAGPELHVDCIAGPTIVTCPQASQCDDTFADDVLTAKTEDGGLAFTCRGSSSVQ